MPLVMPFTLNLFVPLALVKAFSAGALAFGYAI
jgi:hypothetical protein